MFKCRHCPGTITPTKITSENNALADLFCVRSVCTQQVGMLAPRMVLSWTLIFLYLKATLKATAR